MLFEGLFESVVSDNANAWTELQETKDNFFASHNERMKELNEYIKRIEVQHKEFDELHKKNQEANKRLYDLLESI